MNPSSKRHAYEPLPQQQQQQHPTNPPPAYQHHRVSTGTGRESPALPQLSPNSMSAVTNIAEPSSSPALISTSAASSNLVPIFQGREDSAAASRRGGDGNSEVHPHPAEVSESYPGASTAAAQSMALAVVPFTGTSGVGVGVSAPQRCDPRVGGADQEGKNTGVGGDDVGYYSGPSPYGKLAPLSLSTERVCPHCLRPYDVFDDGEGVFDPATFFRVDATTRSSSIQPSSSHPKLLPPPSHEGDEQQKQQPSTSPRLYTEGAGDGGAAAGQLLCSRSSTAAGLDDSSSDGTNRSGNYITAVHPPAAAFTSHYFRALPPPSFIIAAGARGASAPLAIEDYRPSPLIGSPRDEKVEARQPFALAPALASDNGGGGGNSSGTLVCKVAAVPHYSYVWPITCTGMRSQVRLLQQGDSSEKTAAEMEGGKEESPSCESGSPVCSPTAATPSPNNGYYRHYFKELRQLGRGTYGGVYLCRHVMCGVNLGEFALKKIPVGDKVTYLQSVLREVRILEEVRRHPNVVEYKHSWVEEAQLADFGPPVRCLFILMEYASAGSLDTYLERYGNNLSTLAVWYFFLSSVAGTAHLHEKHILHRDLKPQNLLLAATKDRPPRVLVSDFGTAALLDDILYDRSGGTGTLEYMAPELLETTASPRGANERYVNHHTMASDVWSLGMVLHYLAFDGALPERHEDGSVNLDKARHSANARPPEMLRLLEAMLQLDPAKRPRCCDILASPMVQSIMRIFNKDDHSQWDLSIQRQQQLSATSPSAILPLERPPRPPVPAPAPRSAPLNALEAHSIDDSSSPRGARSRNAIAAISTSSQGRGVRADSTNLEDKSNTLQSSRVELLSASTLVDLSTAMARAGSSSSSNGSPLAMKLPPPRPSTVISQHGRQQQQRAHVVAGLPKTLASSNTFQFSDSPSPRRVNVGVQTNPVVIVEKQQRHA
ncbi:protein kinase [Leishmania donovani]|uniref:non-specific serine/threonine protein kinase n=1 Tax=Leishmania donovani TaxID=5661 RepID=A0A6J8FC81_LEIDO|nr:protein kinase [Leishmania donovani]VDZ45350.1 protein_kinase_putative/GeneDB:LmjF.25.1520 [Leishmania donovani]